jgi:hypothetical protein
MSTVITYGDVTIGRVNTTAFDQEPIFDESGVNLLYWRFTVRCVGFLQNNNSGSGCGLFAVQDAGSNLANPSSTTASTIHIAARSKLAPRQAFSMEIDNQVVLSASAMPTSGTLGNLTSRDVNDGPKCTQFRVMQITGNNVFKVEATFEICKVECDVAGAAGGNTTGVLSNRWSAQDSIDTNMRTVRTYTGTVRTAGGFLNPHQFRGIVVPPLQPYLRRDQMQFTATADGKNLQYTITDVEVAVGAPAPLTKWDIQHTETLDEALTSRGELRVVMEGDSLVDKTKMVEIGLWLLYGILARRTPQEGLLQNQILEQVTFTDYVGEVNRVDMFATMRRVPTTIFEAGYLAKTLLVPIQRGILPGFAGNPDDTTPGNDANAGNIYDKTKNRGARFSETLDYQSAGVAFVGLFVAYLQTPCDNVHAIPPGTLPTNSNATPATTPKPTPVTVIRTLPTETENSTLSTSHKTKMYTTYRMESRPIENSMMTAMPIAADTASMGYGSSEPTGADVSCRFIRLAWTQARRRVVIQAERIGEYPEFPDPRLLPGFDVGTNITQTLLKVKRSFEAPDIMPLGQKLYRARFDAVYAVSRLPVNTEAQPIGRNIWTTAGDISTNTVATNGWT